MKIIKESNVKVLPGIDGNAYSSSKYLWKNITVTEEKIIERYNPLTEGIDYEFDEDSRGGVVIFSTDVNAIPQSENKIIDWLKKKAKTIRNRVSGTKMVDKISQAHDLVGWTVGHFLSGRYTAKNGTAFGENSLSVEMAGIDTDTLVNIATELCRSFDQETVLVKDYNNGKIYLVNRD